MFKLVGREAFTVGSAHTKACVNIEAVTGFSYEYTLAIDGKSLEKFRHDRAKVTTTWILKVDGEDCRVVLGEALKPCSASTPSSGGETIILYIYYYIYYTSRCECD